MAVYFAHLQFEKRKPYRHLEARLQKDVKAFFGDYKTAVEAGRQTLFRIADIQEIGDACHLAAVQGIGWLEDSESLQLHTSLVPQLPSILRTYVACGTILYGDISSADLIKIHIRSGKLTLMKFDDFIRPLYRTLWRLPGHLMSVLLRLPLNYMPHKLSFLYSTSIQINVGSDYSPRASSSYSMRTIID